MNEVGEKKVFFLDNLHAKLYLGQQSALVGSANLTDNGFSNEGLQEVAVELDDEDALKRIRATIGRYKKEAQTQYPTAENKRDKLRLMYDQWQKSIRHGLHTENGEAPDISTYTSSLDRIHIIPYQYEGVDFDKDQVYREVPEAVGTSLDQFFNDYVSVSEEDDAIEEGHWVLLWKSNKDGTPNSNRHLRWLRVDGVIPKGVIDETYSKLVVEKADGEHGEGAPFELNKETQHAIKEALREEQFAALRMSNEEDKASAGECVAEFLKFVKKRYVLET